MNPQNHWNPVWVETGKVTRNQHFVWIGAKGIRTNGNAGVPETGGFSTPALPWAGKAAILLKSGQVVVPRWGCENEDAGKARFAMPAIGVSGKWA